jgi:glycosyltransferase involved in cell wall biosynthesis
MVEAIASGLPVIASDLPVHREICQDAGVYFARFSPEELADRVMEVVGIPSVASRLRARGVERSQDFSWSRHTDELVDVATQLARI